MAQMLSQADIEAKLAETKRHISEKWGWFLALGIALIVIGLAAIAFPLVASLATAVFLGWLFVIGGVVIVIHAFSSQGWGGFLWNLLVGLLYLAVGLYLLFSPVQSLLPLAIVLAFMFLVEGVFESIMAFRVRPHEGWGFLLLSGIAAFIVGLIIAMGLPGTALWALGLLVGINLLFSGWSYVFLALAGRKAVTGTPAPAAA